MKSIFAALITLCSMVPPAMAGEEGMPNSTDQSGDMTTRLLAAGPDIRNPGCRLHYLTPKQPFLNEHLRTLLAIRRELCRQETCGTYFGINCGLGWYERLLREEHGYEMDFLDCRLELIRLSLHRQRIFGDGSDSSAR